MNIYLISEYVNRLKKSDITYYAEKQGISLDKEEIELIYNYIKKDYKTIIYGNPKDILNEIKFKVKPLTYSKIENLYIYDEAEVENEPYNINHKKDVLIFTVIGIVMQL